MMKKIWAVLILALLNVEAEDYTKNVKTIDTMNILIKKYHFKHSELQKLFSDVKVQHSALRAFLPRHKQKIRKETRTSEQIKKAHRLRKKYGSWGRYSRNIVSDKRVAQGVMFVKKHRKTFEDVEKKYGVPEEYIAGIIGIESAYGKNVGKYPVFDTLCTLAFEKNRRNKFFKKQLIEFLALSKSEKFNPKNVKGSYAGAIGLVQFMPSNYEHYGVDFNGDGRITLQQPADAIASVANYFKKNGWRKNEPVATRVKYSGTRFNSHKTGYKHTYNRRQLHGISPREKWDYKNKVRLIKLK